MTLKEIALALFNYPQFVDISIQSDHVHFICRDVEIKVSYEEEDSDFFVTFKNVKDTDWIEFNFETFREFLDFVLV